MLPTKTLVALLAVLVSSSFAQKTTNNKPQTLKPTAAHNGTTAANSFSADISCSNARDATIASIATVHQLLAQALAKIPSSSIVAVKQLKNAQAASAKAYGTVGNLANSVVRKANPKDADVKNVYTALNTALVSVGTAVKSEGVVGKVNASDGASQQNVAILTADGPVVVMQAGTTAGSAALLNQAQLQLQSAIKAVSITASCLNVKLPSLKGALSGANNGTKTANKPSAKTAPKATPIDAAPQAVAPKSNVATGDEIPSGVLRPIGLRPWAPLRGGFGWGFRGAVV